MPFSQVFLIIISGLGVIHGLFLAVFLWTKQNGNTLANRLLSLLLIVLSFRIGKSVFLEFLNDLDAKFIFTGLGTLMAIGPLFYLYASACTNVSFRLTRNHMLHFLPCLLAVLFGFWVTDEHLQTLPKPLFFILFISYYSHYLIYLILTRRYISHKQREGLADKKYKLLTLLFYGLLIIWVAYVLNLFE